MGDQEKHLIREFARARTRGDRAEMRRWFEELLLISWPLVRTYVAMQHGSVLRPGEFDDALSRTGRRIATRGMDNFEGSTVGEWKAFLKAFAKRGAQDTQRANATLGSREIPTTLERGDDDPSSSGAFEEAAAELHLAREAAEESAAYIAHIKGFLEWALPQLPAKQRAVWERWHDGVSYEDIGAELGMSADAAYQNKCRAQKQLNVLKRSYES